WLNNLNATILDNSIKVLQNRTQAILKQLNFTWKSITPYMFIRYIKRSLDKMSQKQKILDDLNRVARMLPSPIYWEDTNSVILGANELVLQGTGANIANNYIGKTLYELYPKEMADHIKLHNEEVMRTGKILAQEESIKDITTGEVKYYIAVKSPLFDDDGTVIGLVGTSIDITDRKERERLEIEVHKAVAERLRLENENHKAAVEAERLKLENEANKAALAEKEKLIALKDAERLKHENRKLEAQNKLNQVILEKEAAEAEAKRLRLENELHKLENEKHKVAEEEQAKFRKFVGQIVHDIQSPLSSLRGLVNESSSIIPEEERITLRQASRRISDIAQHMLSRYKNEIDENEMAEPVLVSAAMLEVLGEKRYEHKEVNFIPNFKPLADFAFIQIEPSQFKRMISNLLNNAVEALKNKSDGKIDLRLNANAEWVMITITDNGKGIPQKLIDKIKKGISVTEGKKRGSGIGLTQVCETVQRNFGEMEVLSSEGVRTSILLKFPKIPAPSWIAEEIKISKGDTIVILDDDPSIHGAWDSTLAPSLVKIPGLNVRHFSVGGEAVNFINSLSDKEKKNICLLTDYELLHQNINGLQVIEQTKIKRSTLVTSHYANKGIREHATNLRVKILPKELAFAVTINLNKKIKPCSKKVDIVWVDD
ncbi:MAG TPA: PAS domain-containing sensor histidine kinase, partial [Aquella sp.]|nr:PAS domain-containing sensor histidine kinase [Aquella sp.]